MSAPTEKAAQPVAWRWEGRDRGGYWTRKLTAYKPSGGDDQYCRNVEPLFLGAPAKASGA